MSRIPGARVVSVFALFAVVYLTAGCVTTPPPTQPAAAVPTSTVATPSAVATVAPPAVVKKPVTSTTVQGSGTQGGGSQSTWSSEQAEVARVFRAWVNAMSDMKASPESGSGKVYWVAKPRRPWDEGDVRMYYDGYAIDSITVRGDEATVKATFHVDHMLWSNGTSHRGGDYSYNAVLVRGSNGHWLLTSASGRRLIPAK